MAEISQPERVSGTQAISRAARILRMIARKGVHGARLTDVTRLTGLPHPTIRRILTCLIEEGFVIQDSLTKRYSLGPLNFELGLATIREVNSEQAYRQTLVNLARISGDTVYLMARSGADIVCLDREEGSYPVRAHLFSIGSRRPIGFGAAGLALLSALEDSTIRRVLEINAHEIEVHPKLTLDTLWKAIELTRIRGYAVTMDIYTMGIGSIGMAVPNGDLPPVYAINLSVAGSARFTPDRVAELGTLIKSQIALPSEVRSRLSDDVQWEFQ